MERSFGQCKQPLTAKLLCCYLNRSFSFDHNDEFGKSDESGNSKSTFKAYHKHLMESPAVRAFKGYVKDNVTSASDGEGGDEEPRIVRKASKPIIQLAKTSETKISLLPKNALQPFNIDDDKKQLKFQKDLVRAMATDMYRMYSLPSCSGRCTDYRIRQSRRHRQMPMASNIKASSRLYRSPSVSSTEGPI